MAEKTPPKIGTMSSGPGNSQSGDSKDPQKLSIDTSILNTKSPQEFRVAVAIEENLDSLVTAILLKKQGLQVLGVVGLTWEEGQYRPPQCAIKDINLLKNLCDEIEIPFFAINNKAEFQDEVVEPVVLAQLMGQMPLSCYRCFKLRTLSLFNRMAKINADFLALPVYAKIFKNKNTGEFYISRSNDPESDQSDSLAFAPQELLKKLLLPLSELKRSEVSKLGHAFLGRNPFEKREKGDCFPADQRIQRVIENIPEKFIRPGQALNIQTKALLYDHLGVHRYSFGQLWVENNNQEKELKVVDIDYGTQTVWVGKDEDSRFNACFVDFSHFSKEVDRSRPESMLAKFISGSHHYPCEVYFKSLGAVLVKFPQSPLPIIRNGDQIAFFKTGGKSFKLVGEGRVKEKMNYQRIDRCGDFKKQDEDGTGEVSSARF